jgi:hypothetical protein
MRSTNTRYLDGIRELYIDFRVDAFAYNTVDPSRACGIRDDIAADIANNFADDTLA